MLPFKEERDAKRVLQIYIVQHHICIVVMLGIMSIFLIYVLSVFIPTLTVFVRRLRDVGKNGYFYFMAFIPMIKTI